MKNKALVVNVLSLSDYENCHIQGSISVPFNQLEQFAQKTDKDQEIVVYCARYECPLSRNAFKLLKERGFANVKAYEGGIVEWCQKGYPVIGACSVDLLSEENMPESPEAGIETISAEELQKKL